MCRALFVPAVVLVSLGAAEVRAQGKKGDAQSLGGPVRTEIDVVHTDAGTFVPVVEPGAQVVPPELIEPSPAPYPPALADTPINGTVVLELLIDERGAVQETKVHFSTDPRFEAVAVEASLGLKFKPARVKGQPAAVRLQYSYLFEAPPPPPTLGTLAGEIRQKGTRKPVVGAVLVGPDGQTRGESGPDGRFTVELPAGTYALSIEAHGHATLKVTETIAANQKVEVLYRIEPLIADPYETIVRGERERTEVSRHTLQGAELREVPGTQGDPFRVIMLMPGVSSLASGLSYPVVRGSQPAATGYFIDGVRVPALFHLLLGPAVVHPDFLDRLDFYPGTPPPQYGRVLGGVVNATVSRPRDDRVHATAYADLINSGAFGEYTYKPSGTSATLAGRVSYTPWILARVGGLLTPPDSEGYRTVPIADFWDYQGRVNQVLPAGQGHLRLLAFGSSDKIGAESENPRGIDAHLFNRFHRVDLRYTRRLPVGDLEVGATYGYDAVGIDAASGDSTTGGAFGGDFALTTHTFTARAIYSLQLSDRWSFLAGADVDHRRAISSIGFQVSPGAGSPDVDITFEAPLALGTFVGGYVSGIWEPTQTTTVTAGFRVDNYHLTPGIDRLALEPRLTARHELFKGFAVKGGAAVVHQAPTVLLTVPVLDISGLRYGLQEAMQVDVGAEWTPLPGLEITADTYFTYIPTAIELDLATVFANRERDPALAALSATKQGRSYGFELMIRHPLGNNWFGWIAYTLQRSERLQRFVRFDDSFQVVEVAQAYLPFAFDQTHLFNLAVSYKFPGNITAGAVVHFNTGRPESGQISSRTQRAFIDPITGDPAWVPVSRDQLERLPSFFRVDARVSKLWTFNDFTLELYFDMLNASIQSEILAYQYWAYGGQRVREPLAVPVIVPMLGLKGVY